MKYLKFLPLVLFVACGPRPDNEKIIGSWDLVSYQMDANSDPMSIEPGSPASYTYTFDENMVWTNGKDKGSYAIDPEKKKITIKGEIPDLGPYSKKWDYELANDSLTLSSLVNEDLIINILIKKTGTE